MTVLRVTTLGDLRKLTKDLPDDTALVIDMGDCWEFFEVSDSMRVFPAALDAPAALLLTPGQEIREDHHLIPRLDVWLEYGEYLK